MLKAFTGGWQFPSRLACQTGADVVICNAASWPFWAWIILAVGACLVIAILTSAICACVRCCKSSSDRPHTPAKGAPGQRGYPIGAYAGQRAPSGFPMGNQHQAPTDYPPAGGYPQPQYAGYPTGPMGVPPPGSARAGPRSAPEFAAPAGAAAGQGGQRSGGRQGSPRGKKGTPRGARDALATV